MIPMSSIGKVDVIRARLQEAGVSFNDAQRVTKKESERAHDDPEYFASIVRRLTKKCA